MTESPLASPNSFPFGQEVVWEPDPDIASASNLRKFMDRHNLSDLDALQERSTADVAWFWEAVLEDLNIEFYRDYEKIVDLSEGIQRPTWCVGGKMNIVHNLLDTWQGTPVEDRIALRWEGEDESTRTLTYGELHRRVCRCANALRDLGLGKGDRIGLYMPMTPEIVIAFLAIVKIGGVLLPLFSGYGVGAIQCPSVEHVVVHRHLGRDDTPMTDGRDHFWDDVMAGHSTEARTARTDAEDVVMIIYTSGTTGPPKGTVHTHCGFPIKGAQDMYHPMDLKPGETMYWMSDMGWMMGPWLVFGTLTIGATMVLYDGAPDHPDPGRLWRMVDDHEVTHLGVSPTLIRALKTHGDAPVNASDRSSLRAIGSTGSPWDPESWRWCFETVLNGEKPILNYSGGTEISGGILCGNFLEPLKPAAFSGPVPGMDADVVDAEGTPVRGEVGELVLRKPWIGMTRGFWGEDDRYHDAYWNRFDDLWVHGDFAAVDADGLWYILGRSDDTINVAGKRLGPAEIEALLNAHEAVAESAAIGVPHDVKGSEIVAFAVLEPGRDESDDLREELLQGVVDEMGKPLKPREILFADALPKTRNAKVMRRVIRAAYLDEDLGDTSSLDDPSTIEAIRAAR
ncbi:MAG: AMP-dependent synthetase [Bacteroidetes bacterium QH_2_64_74]|nr:MAG: AMP-dependent synthetase [Bacteroidetes bacterium QH_2_64_74]